MAGIRIDGLDSTILPSRSHVLPAMNDGLSVKLAISQILSLLSREDLAGKQVSEDIEYHPGGAEFLSAENVQDALDEIAVHISDPWAIQPIGVLIPVSDDLVPALVPPTDKSYRYVKLTAGEAGAGQYNEGILTGQSVSGSAPLVTATAVINLAESPVNGKTVHLINTERRFLRAGAAGSVETDQMQQITGAVNSISSGASSAGFTLPEGAFTLEDPVTRSFTSDTATPGRWGKAVFDSADSPGARAGDETRPKNIGVTYFMRVL